MEIKFDREFTDKISNFKVLKIEADVVNAPTPDALWHEIQNAGDKIRASLQLADINKRPAISGTRKAYKALGKDPNRYRPSAEALCRRLAKNMELYRIDILVDLINLISIKSGYSIGGFDIDKICGDTLTLGVGNKDDIYEAIGRGILNIEGLPVYRDSIGGIGTPTSDVERTKLSIDTKRLLMTINIYETEMPIENVKELTIELLKKYANATNITSQLFETI